MVEKLWAFHTALISGTFLDLWLRTRLVTEMNYTLCVFTISFDGTLKSYSTTFASAVLATMPFDQMANQDLWFPTEKLHVFITTFHMPQKLLHTNSIDQDSISTTKKEENNKSIFLNYSYSYYFFSISISIQKHINVTDKMILSS